MPPYTDDDVEALVREVESIKTGTAVARWILSALAAGILSVGVLISCRAIDNETRTTVNSERLDRLEQERVSLTGKDTDLQRELSKLETALAEAKLGDAHDQITDRRLDMINDKIDHNHEMNLQWRADHMKDMNEWRAQVQEELNKIEKVLDGKIN